MDNEILKQRYPDIDLTGSDIVLTKYINAENVDTSEKSYVVDWILQKRQWNKGYTALLQIRK